MLNVQKIVHLLDSWSRNSLLIPLSFFHLFQHHLEGRETIFTAKSDAHVVTSPSHLQIQACVDFVGSEALVRGLEFAFACLVDRLQTNDLAGTSG